MEALAGLFAEVLLIFEEFKFWLKRRKQRRYEQKHNLPPKRMWSPLLKIMVILILVVSLGFLLRANLFLHSKEEKQTTKKLSEVILLLEHEKKSTGEYPKKLSTIIRNNPLLKRVGVDYWNRDFVYTRHATGESYNLYSLGKDGVADTEDDIMID
ncbi:type II secretion system protein GspG [uncultured Gelidibacter sp.]|uniref:type II secretion system protein GspG n=1 Tax=uncultured Gelidibacter sp. TaxID=259318 RepID=UPI00261AD0F2|nr:type II secretion system protein GspG [uncultured Gelidibacter sp.]